MFTRAGKLLQQFSRAFLLQDVRHSLNSTQKAKIAASSTLAIVNTFAKITIPAAFSQSIKMMATNQATKEVFGIDFTAGNLLCIAISLSAWQLVEENFRNALMDEVASAFRIDLSKKLLGNSYALTYQDHNKIKGKLCSADWLINDVGTKLPLGVVNQLLPAAFDAVTGIVYVWTQLGTALGAVFLVYALASILILNLLLIAFTKIQERTDAYRILSNETWNHSFHLLENRKTIEMYGCEEKELKQNEKNRADTNTATELLNQANRTYDYLAKTPVLLAYLVFAYYLGNTYQNGITIIQPILFLFTYIGMFGSDINKLNSSVKNTIQTQTTLEEWVLPYTQNQTKIIKPSVNKEEKKREEAKREITSLPTPQNNYEHKAPMIEFKNVTFSHEEKKPLLQNVSFQIKPGKRTALVGFSGCGKSTLLDLIMGFAKPTHGTIEIDGQDITTLSRTELSQLRTKMAVVFQAPDIFKFKSIEDNINYGSTQPASKEKTEALMEQVELGPLKKRKNERCDQDNLSGGEKQKVCYARCLSKLGIFDSSINPVGVVLLDELTAHMDPVTATKILENMRTHTQGRTVLYTTHQLQNIGKDDDIIVLNNGQVERVTHQTLLQHNGTNATLYHPQFHDEVSIKSIA